MKSHKNTALLIFALLAVLGITVLGALRSQSQSNSPSANPDNLKKDNLKKAAEDFYTITDYAASEPTDPRKRALRRVRAKRHNMRAQQGVDPRQFMITEERESSFATPPFDVPLEPVLPAATSDAVLIGEVTNAQAFLTEDKTSIISEFTVHVSDSLKNKTGQPLAFGDSIDAIRGGGAVRLPSGKVIRHGLFGRPFPRVGRKYVFFLKYDSEGQDFVILTAYELRAGCVFPLDGSVKVGETSDRLPDYQRYKDVDEGTFLYEVREAIANASHVFVLGSSYVIGNQVTS